MAPVACVTGSYVDFDGFVEADECLDDVVTVKIFRAGSGFLSHAVWPQGRKTR